MALEAIKIGSGRSENNTFKQNCLEKSRWCYIKHLINVQMADDFSKDTFICYVEKLTNDG